jgi:4-alpha-glucanotransferase
MTASIQLCLVLHNHQPIGNFDGVFEQAYQDSYLPFLDVFEPYENLRISLHTSGPLMLWLHERKPEYMMRLKALVAADRVEIVGGPFYESILTMLPSRDRIGQIQRYTTWLEERFETNVRGMWVPERVWESSLTSDLADAGMQYTVLDDFHFKAAGCAQEELFGYYATEDNGRLLRVFPGSEKLRYLIPFAPVADMIEFAKQTAQQHPGAILVFGDDGEKFGTWPDTKVHVYENGWLRDFLNALNDNRQWLQTARLADVVQQNPPVGKVYLPDCSYREMTEWALPVTQQEVFEESVHAIEHEPIWDKLRRFVRGGSWRNFKVKYIEANEMYCRMLDVSERLEKARQDFPNHELLELAEDHLYRGQCNCTYWHGAFGGIYLPHLRNAVFKELIEADNLLDAVAGRTSDYVDGQSQDFNLDFEPEVRMSNSQLIGWVAPAQGGMLYELDVRGLGHNLLANIRRRPESYHRKVLKGASASSEKVASIHDRVVFKQAGLDQRLQYDKYTRKSMQDHFFDESVTLEALIAGHAQERGDFLQSPYQAKLRRGAGKVQIFMQRDGNAFGVPLQVSKALTLEAGSSTLRIGYQIDGLPAGRPFHFASEWNFAGMPAGADDRFFYNSSGQRLGQLGAALNLSDLSQLGLIDQWLSLDVQLLFDTPTHVWAFPIETVSQSEGGYELVHQSVCVIPHWTVIGDAQGRWATEMEIAIQITHQPEAKKFGSHLMVQSR